MEKEELKNILDDLNVSKVISLELTYIRNYEIGIYGYGNEPKHHISYLKREE